jgi:arylsulfatase A-like enzyme
LAQTGVLFKNAVAQGPATFPSVNCTLTSKYAANFFYTRKCRLEKKDLTLAEVLREAGYYTAGFSSSPLITRGETTFSLGGFEQGFDSFDDSIWNGKKWNWQWRSPEGIIENALTWLDKNRERKFFLFLYIMDPHCMYNPPGPYKTLYNPGYKGKENIMKGHPSPYEVKIIRGLNTDLTDQDIKHLVALYDGEIKYADEQIGKLLERIQQLNLEKKTLVILTSDHGEEFFDHGGVKHGYTLYNELIKIPTIMRYPSLIPGGTEVDEIVQSIDIVPTILEAAGVEKPEIMNGKSLLSLIRGKDVNWRDYAISEVSWVDAKAIVTKKWKYIHHFETELVLSYLCDKYTKGRELYDLESDPKELNNIYVENKEIAGKLYNQMMSVLPKSERERVKLGETIEIDEETQEQLRSLGYLK